MPGPDPSHWLHRFTADEWLVAAGNEERALAVALAQRGVRAAVTHARRAAGMAANAVLVAEPDEGWGRSYMQHVVALGDAPTVPEAVRSAARVLRDTPPAPPALVRLGAPDPAVRDAARIIIAWAHSRLSPSSG